MAFSGPDDLDTYGMSNGRVYVRAIADRGKPFRKLGDTFDGDVTIGFWSKDGSTIYFNEGIKATNQIVSLDVRYNTVRPLTEEKASVSIDQDADDRRPADQLRRRHDAADAVHRSTRSPTPARARRGGS